MLPKMFVYVCLHLCVCLCVHVCTMRKRKREILKENMVKWKKL